MLDLVLGSFFGWFFSGLFVCLFKKKKGDGMSRPDLPGFLFCRDAALLFGGDRLDHQPLHGLLHRGELEPLGAVGLS